jgi:acyl-CoA synthetase (AMP-forming)/AMP-acid ligase II
MRWSAAGGQVVRGPNVMQGYLNMPEATAEVLLAGFARTTAPTDVLHPQLKCHWLSASCPGISS